MVIVGNGCGDYDGGYSEYNHNDRSGRSDNDGG